MRNPDRLIVALAVLALLATPSAQQRDATTVLADMRQALGGGAALDAVRTFTAGGSRTLSSPMGSRRLALEWFAVLPDHFLEVRRDSPSGPISIDIIYYSGIAGSRVIQKTDSRGLPMPEMTYADNSPAAVAAREQAALVRAKQMFARLTLALFGTSTASYPLEFSLVGIEPAEGRSYEVIDATAAEGVVCRLHVDTGTHLPAMLTWQDERPFVISSSSVVTTTTRGGRAVSQSEPTPMPAVPYKPQGMAPKRWIFSNFKAQDGINWPRRIEEEFEGTREEIRLGSVKINPKIDARKFDVK